MYLRTPIYLPYPDPTTTASVMSEERLLAQAQATIEILNAIAGPKGDFWRGERVVQMWYGNEWTLVQYGLAFCNRLHKLNNEVGALDLREELIGIIRFCQRSHKFHIYKDKTPEWMGNEELHNSHKGRLYRKEHGEWCRGGDPDGYLIIKPLGWSIYKEMLIVLPEISEGAIEARTAVNQQFIPMDVGRGKRLLRTTGGVV